jgi:hypothetical protein
MSTLRLQANRRRLLEISCASRNVCPNERVETTSNTLQPFRWLLKSLHPQRNVVSHALGTFEPSFPTGCYLPALWPLYLHTIRIVWRVLPLSRMLARSPVGLSSRTSRSGESDRAISVEVPPYLVRGHDRPCPCHSVWGAFPVLVRAIDPMTSDRLFKPLALAASHRDIAWFDDLRDGLTGGTVVFLPQPTDWKAGLISASSFGQWRAHEALGR